METATGIEFKMIYGADLEALAPLIRSRGWIPLNPMTACALVAYEGETMVGFCAMNPIPHVEPLFVSLEHRGTGLAAELVEMMVDFLYKVEAPAAYIIANSPFSAKLAEAYGMERVTEPVYRLVARK